MSQQAAAGEGGGEKGRGRQLHAQQDCGVIESSVSKVRWHCAGGRGGDGSQRVSRARNSVNFQQGGKLTIGARLC